MGINSDKYPVEQNNCRTKIVNAYIVYDLHASPRNLTNYFIVICLFVNGNNS